MATNDPFEKLAEAQTAADQLTTSAATQPWSEGLVIYLSTSILAIIALALLLGTFLMWKKSTNGQDVLRLFGVVIIVGLSSLLLITGYDKDQLTPIVGLFGAIAGYLLGKESPKEGNNAEK